MNIKNFKAIIFVLFCCASFGLCEDQNNQLKINHWTLSNSADEQIRIDTAKELLLNPSLEARKILLAVLGSTDNAAAASSVCKAISSFRSSADFIPNRHDFILPLMNILKGQNPETGKLAAQAALIFSFKEIKNYLDPIFLNPELADTTRRNAVYALQIRPDKESVLQLIDLLELNDAVISTTAAQALNEWIPIGANKKEWRRIKLEIEKGKFDIVRERLLTSQDRIMNLNETVLKWQKKYLSSLDNIYTTMTDDNIRARFVAENLTFEQTSVKLWAVEKISMWQKSGKLLPIDVLQNPLVALVSDSDPDVRIAAVRLLGLLPNINSSEALLAQLKKEVFPDVKTEIIISLSHVCNFALSPGSEMEINPQVRNETLTAAVEHFKDVKPVESAEVIRNLLLQNGLEAYEVKPYFEYIAANYNKAQDDQVRIRLLEEMQRLCGNDSFYRAIAGDSFRDIFLLAIDNKSSLIAVPAVSGLLRIDQAGAFDILKAKNFAEHASSKIRAEMIAAAGQIGTAKDLDWLNLIADNAETEDERQRAAEAMMNIFQYCQTDVLITWGQKFSDKAKAKKEETLFAKSRILLETAEKKAEAQQDANTLTSLRWKLADSYSQATLYVQAAKYYGVLLQNAVDPNEKQDLTAKLLNVNIRGGQSESAKQLLANILLSGDIGPDNIMCKVLEKYFREAKSKEAASKILRAIAAIELPNLKKYPLWSEELIKWRVLLANNGKPVDANSVVADSNGTK